MENNEYENSSETISLEETIFELQCQVSMLTDYVSQLVNDLNYLGINVSKKLND